MNTTTNSLAVKRALHKKIRDLFDKQKITINDIQDFSQRERACLGRMAQSRLEKLKGAKRDEFLNKTELIFDAGTRHSLWEHNQMVISTAIANYINTYGVMPPIQIIVKEAGLSRQTVAKHIKEYKQSTGFEAENEQFKLMTNKMLANVFRMGSKGDMRAARLYFEMVGAINKPQAGTVVNKQNNYIQINNTILSQENLKNLSAEQLNQIENIVTHKQYQITS
ncbi:MAG: hypothetical protein V4592_01985 [Bacteroidota bacterium]